jgi:hypothetical protein
MSPRSLVFTLQAAGVAMFILGISTPAKAHVSDFHPFQNPATVKQEQEDSKQNRMMTLKPAITDTPPSDSFNPDSEVTGESEVLINPLPKGEGEETNSDALAPPNTDNPTDTEPNPQREDMPPTQPTEPPLTPATPGNQDSHNNTFNFELNLGGGGSSAPFGGETMPQPPLEEFSLPESQPNVLTAPLQVTPQNPSPSTPVERNELKPTQEKKNKHKRHKRQKKEQQPHNPEHLQLQHSDTPGMPETRPGQRHRRRHPNDLKRHPIDRRPTDLQPRPVPKPRILRPQMKHHTRPRLTHPPKRHK